MEEGARFAKRDERGPHAFFKECIAGFPRIIEVFDLHLERSMLRRTREQHRGVLGTRALQPAALAALHVTLHNGYGDRIRRLVAECHT